MSKRCDGCVNYFATGTEFRADVTGGSAPAGECRIGPPQPTLTLLAHRWPLVWADEWCGCHLPAAGPTLAERVAPVYDPEPDVLSFPGVPKRGGK